jgi:quercetin dioxygenase-like cupin family protein
MPIVCKAKDRTAHGRDLRPEEAILKTDSCEVYRLIVAPGERLSEHVGAEDIIWLLLLSGRASFGDDSIDGSTVVVAGPDCQLTLVATETLELLWVKVPRASRFDAGIGPANGICLVDWKREPVLQSEHDARTRIYMTTPALSGTTAVKAEVITYPAGAAAPEHYHEGAEHFQYVISGSGTAVLNGDEQPLEAGDILYNFPNEWHYFVTDPAAEDAFVFVELFVPGKCKTIWVEDANACAWLPTGKDVRGAVPVREIAHHVHGEDAGL